MIRTQYGQGALKAGSENIPLVVTKKLSLKYWLGFFLSVMDSGPRFQKLSIRDSQNGIASPKWPRTIFRLGYSSNRPLQIRRMALNRFLRRIQHGTVQEGIV